METATLILPDLTPESSTVLEGLKKGYDATGCIFVDHQTSPPAPKTVFYVIISCEGIHKYHVALRLFSKLFSAGAFTFSTALFASASLMQITIATVIMTMILAAGIFGRITAMWISGIIMQDKPVLHRIVRTEKDANIFVEAVLRKQGLVCEVLGHVIINGRCVQRRKRLDWGNVVGVLARPIDIMRIATKSNA